MHDIASRLSAHVYPQNPFPPSSSPKRPHDCLRPHVADERNHCRISALGTDAEPDLFSLTSHTRVRKREVHHAQTEHAVGGAADMGTTFNDGDRCGHVSPIITAMM